MKHDPQLPNSPHPWPLRFDPGPCLPALCATPGSAVVQSSLSVVRVVRLAGAAASRLWQAALAVLLMVAPALLVSSASLASPEYVTW